MKSSDKNPRAVPVLLYVVVDIVLCGVGLVVVFSVPTLRDVLLMWIPIVVLIGIILSAPISRGIWSLRGRGRVEPEAVEPPAPPPAPDPPTRIELPGRDRARERRYPRPGRE